MAKNIIHIAYRGGRANDRYHVFVRKAGRVVEVDTNFPQVWGSSYEEAFAQLLAKLAEMGLSGNREDYQLTASL